MFLTTFERYRKHVTHQIVCLLTRYRKSCGCFSYFNFVNHSFVPRVFTMYVPAVVVQVNAGEITVCLAYFGLVSKKTGMILIP